MVEEKKILLVRLSSFGDIVLTFPLINLLKRKFPESHITFVVKEKYSELLKMNPFVDTVLSVKEGKLSVLKDLLSAGNFDISIDLQNNAKSRYLTSSLSNVCRYRKNNLKKFLLVKFKINLLKDPVPVYRKYINSVREVIPIGNEELEFTTSKLSYTSFDSREDKYTLIAPSSRHFTKTYPKEKFIEFINNNSETRFILVGDDSDTDKEICSYISSHTDNSIDLCGKLNFSALAGVIDGAERVICNDSGVLHLAEAMGKDVTAIFGSTVKEFGFFPQLADSEVFENNKLKCRPCSHTGLPSCPLKHFKCMRDVTLH